MAIFHQWIKSPTSEELARLTHTIAKRIGRFLERQGLLIHDTENSYLSSNVVEDEYDPMHQVHGASVTYRIAVGPRQGHKVFTLQTLPASDPEEWADRVDGFSLYAGVAAKAHERKKRERICRYIARPLVAERRLTRIDTTWFRVNFQNAAGCGRALFVHRAQIYSKKDQSTRHCMFAAGRDR